MFTTIRQRGFSVLSASRLLSSVPRPSRPTRLDRTTSKRARPPVALRLEELERRQTPSVSVVPQHFATPQYTALNITQEQLLAGDTGSPALTVADPTQPAHAALVDNHNGTYTFTPESGFTGSTSFEYTVRPGPVELTSTSWPYSGLYNYSGWSVAVDGNTAVVGVTGKGVAYVFVRSGDTWTQQATLSPADGSGFYDSVSVSISGDTAVIGDPSRTPVYFGKFRMPGPGAAFVFVRSGTTWSQQAVLTLPDGFAGDAFGSSVSVSGDTAVVGAYNRQLQKPQPFFHGQGAAYVYVRSGDTWTQQATLTAAGAAPGDYFGRSVSLSGDTALVGSQAGRAYVFTRSGGAWGQQAEIAPAPDSADHFDYPVSLSGATALIMGNLEATDGAKHAAAYVFARSGGTWSQQARLDPAGGTLGEEVGAPVSLSGDIAVLAAPEGSEGNQAVYEFVRQGATWSQANKFTKADVNWYAGNYGSSIAVSGDTALIGSVYYLAAGQPASGTVVVQDLSSAAATATVQVNPATAQLVVAPDTLPAGNQGAAYPSPTLTATGGAGGPYTFRQSGVLPAGLTFDAATARLVGTPTQAGTFPGIIVAASDGQGGSGSQTYSLTVNPPADLALRLQGPLGSITEGRADFTVVVGNMGPGPAANVTVTFTLLPGTVLIDSHPWQGTSTESSGTVTWNLGALAPGATIGGMLAVGPTQSMPFGFTARASSDMFDPTPADATASVTLPVANYVSYVTSLYQDLLGRAPDAPGLTYWTSLLGVGATREQVVAAVYGSPEHCGVMVDQDYAAYLHRPADPAGRSYWVSMLLAGVSETDVARGFLTSAEYMAGLYSIESYVPALYVDVLGRAPASAEMAYWQAVEKFGLTPAMAAQAVLTSAESCRLQAEQDYQELLGRPGEPAGVDYWTAMMTSGRMSPAEVTMAFLTSEEYLGHLNPTPQ